MEPRQHRESRPVYNVAPHCGRCHNETVPGRLPKVNTPVGRRRLNWGWRPRRSPPWVKPNIELLAVPLEDEVIVAGDCTAVGIGIPYEKKYHALVTFAC